MVGDFILGLAFNLNVTLATTKAWTLLKTMFVLDSTSSIAFLNSCGARMKSSCASLLGVQGEKKPSVVDSLKVHCLWSGLANCVFIMKKLLAKQKSPRHCLLSRCSSGRRATCPLPSPKIWVPITRSSIGAARPWNLAFVYPSIKVGACRVWLRTISSVFSSGHVSLQPFYRCAGRNGVRMSSPVRDYGKQFQSICCCGVCSLSCIPTVWGQPQTLHHDVLSFCLLVFWEGLNWKRIYMYLGTPGFLRRYSWLLFLVELEGQYCGGAWFLSTAHVFLLPSAHGNSR